MTSHEVKVYEIKTNNNRAACQHRDTAMPAFHNTNERATVLAPFSM
jgi:hypothetical protein